MCCVDLSIDSNRRAVSNCEFTSGIDGIAGAAWAPGDRIRAVLSFTVVDGKVTAIDLVADRQRLDQLDVELLPREGK